MRAICWDLDGTLANHNHRKHFVEGDTTDYDSFIQAIPLDMPNADVVWMFHHFRASPGVKTIIVTNRPERALVLTRQWMTANNLPYDDIYMRPDDDYRDSATVKGESVDRLRVDGFNPILAVDDKAIVVDMWRSKGITCLQCAVGKYD